MKKGQFVYGFLGYIISSVVAIFWAMSAWNEFETTGNTTSLSIVCFTSLMFLVLIYSFLIRVRTHRKEK